MAFPPSVLTISDAIRYAFRHYKVDGVPASGENEPDKDEVNDALTRLPAALNLIALASGVSLAKATADDLQEDLDWPEDVLALVHSDADVANIGVWEKLGSIGSGSWVIRIPMGAELGGAISAIQTAVTALQGGVADHEARLDVIEPKLATFVVTGEDAPAFSIGDELTAHTAIYKGGLARNPTIDDLTSGADGSITALAARVDAIEPKVAQFILTGDDAPPLSFGDGLNYVRAFWPDEDDDASAEIQTGVVHKARLARTRMKLAMRLSGHAAKISICLPADSKTDRDGWLGGAVAQWRALYGDGGAGTIRLFGGVGPASAEGRTVYSDFAGTVGTLKAGYVVTRTGTWTVRNPSSSGTPAPGVLLTSGTATAAASVTVTADAGLTTQTSVKLYYVPASGASCRYRQGSGSWTTLDLSTGYVATLAVSLPASDSVTVEWVAGSVELCGLRCLNDQSGVVVDKIALGGMSLVKEWAPQVADAGFVAQLADMAPDAAIIYLGTNDTGYDVGAVGASMETLIDGMRAVVPWTGKLGLDVAIVAPAVWFGTAGPIMRSFADRFREIADDRRCAFVSVQDSFPIGDDLDPAAYADFWDGGKHETPPFGMSAVAATLIPLLTL